MTVKRDFELSDLNAEQLVQEAADRWNGIDGVAVDTEETELTICSEGKYWARAWVEIGDSNAR